LEQIIHFQYYIELILSFKRKNLMFRFSENLCYLYLSKFITLNSHIYCVTSNFFICNANKFNYPWEIITLSENRSDRTTCPLCGYKYRYERSFTIFLQFGINCAGKTVLPPRHSGNELFIES